MSKVKRNVSREARPAATTEKQDLRWGQFFEDWGRLIIPVAGLGIPMGLKALGVLSDNATGLIIGIEALVVVAGAFGALLWRMEMPSWVRKASIVAALLYVAGAVVPFVETVYPGSPSDSVVVSKDGGEVTLANSTSGWHRVDVYAQSFAEAAGTRTGQGQYRLQLGGKELEGEFNDSLRSVRGRKGMSSQVEDMHYLEYNTMKLNGSPMTLKASRIDQAIGPELRVSVYPMIVPPWLLYGLLGLVILFAVAIDGLYQDQTWQWRFSPWAGAAAMFLVVFNASYEPAKMPGAAIWSVVFGGLGGFLVGWLLSLISRKLLGKVRTRI
jgi:hypothetical protein